ncbi:MAG: LCP family protein, partial [Bifidobacteriaceae bacterium]|nr:LCP family protein [Bifidobacteriaceae bacterium]
MPSYAGAHATSKPPNRTLTWTGRILAVLLVMAAVAGIYGVWRLHVLPNRMFYGAAIVAAIIALATAAGLWLIQVPPTSGVKFSLLAALAVIGIAASSFAVKASLDITNTVEEWNQPKTPRTGYSIIALKTHADPVESLAGQTMGEIETDPNLALVEGAVQELVEVNLVPLPDPADIASQLTGQTIDAAVLDSNYLDMYEEANPDFYDSIKVLTTFELKAADVAQATPDAPTREPGTDAPFIVYISGIDTFGSIELTARSDVNILIVLNPATHKILLVNTPRDYYLQLHGTTGIKDKLTHAGLYGIQMSIDTLQDLYGISIDYYVRVNFTSLVRIVDTLDGINVESQYAFTSRYGHYYFAQGDNYLNGDQALAFSRERYAFEGGDRTRGQNQQQVIKGLIKKATQPGNLLRYNQMLDAVSGSVQM